VSGDGGQFRQKVENWSKGGEFLEVIEIVDVFVSTFFEGIISC